MYELPIFILLSVTLECGMGIIFGIAVGYDPLFVFTAAILLNFLSVIIVGSIIERLLEWKKGFRDWLERRLHRGQKIIDKYGCVGIVLGIAVLSPIQLAIVGKLLGIKPSKLYPSLMGAILVAAFSFSASLKASSNSSWRSLDTSGVLTENIQISNQRSTLL